MKKIILVLLMLNARVCLSDDWINPYFFHVIGSCNESQTMKFESLDTKFTTSAAKTPEGKSIFLLLKVALLSNQNFFAQYEEYTIDENAGTINDRHSVYSQNLIGSWEKSSLVDRQIDLTLDKAIIFSLKITKMKINGNFLVEAQRWPALGRGPAENARLGLFMTATNLGARGESAIEYCKQPY